MRKSLEPNGFTIVETLFVLTIIAIVTALALPRLDGAAKQRELDMFAQNLASDIRLVQQLSVNSGGLKKTLIYFLSENNGQYYYLISDGGIALKRVNLPKTINWGLPKTVQFAVTGAPATVSGVNSAQTITLTSSDGRALYVIIAPVTGRVRVTGVANAGGNNI